MASYSVGPCYLRPYQLGYRKDFGLSSSCEPEELVQLAELVLMEGCPS